MTDRISVALFFGGRGAEHEISIRSAEAIFRHIDKARFCLHPVFISRDGAFWRLPDALAALPSGEGALALGKPTFPVYFDGVAGLLTDEGVFPIDLAIPALHGDFGEDGRLQGLFDSARIRYAGEEVLTGAVGADKALTKILLSANGVPVVPFVTLTSRDTVSAALQKIHEKGLTFPLFLKSTSFGSSIGAMRVDNEGMLDESLTKSKRYGRLLLEKYITPVRELEVSAIRIGGELRLSQPAEIVSAGGFYDYDEKYNRSTAKIDLSPTLPEKTTEAIRVYARTACEVLGVRMLSRLDFFLSGDGSLYFNEINTFPGFTDTSLFPRQAASLGLDFTSLITHLCEAAYAGDF